MTTYAQILAEMLYSGDPLELNAIYEGQSVYGDLPLCLPLPTHLLHGAIRGKTSSGKTLEEMRQITKLCVLRSPPRRDYLRRRGLSCEDESIVCFDQEPDDALFNSSRIDAAIGDMEFKPLDPRLGEQSCVYNPCEQAHHKLMT